MLGNVPEHITEMLSSETGIIVLVLIGVLEGMMLMYFMPSELLVPVSLFVYGTSTVDIISVVAVICASTTLGQAILFMISSRIGKQTLVSKGWFKIPEEKLDRYESWFDKWGIRIIPITNSLPFVRGLATVPAGFSNLSVLKFSVMSLAGTIVFQSVMAVLYLYGSEYLPEF